MTTPHASFGFDFETVSQQESDTSSEQPQQAQFVAMPAVKRKRVIRGGRVRIKLGKKKVVSVAPSTLIGHISSAKLKAAARSVIRQQAVGVKRSRRRRGGKKRNIKRRKRRSGVRRKRKTNRKNKKLASFIV